MTDSEEEFSFENVTTKAFVEMYESSGAIFRGLLGEIRELSKKKAEATMSASKVKIVNRVLEDLLIILKEEPEGKYLDRLDDEALPQMSDAVLVMVQFETALQAFKNRYYNYGQGLEKGFWITTEQLADWDGDEDDSESCTEGGGDTD